MGNIYMSRNSCVCVGFSSLPLFVVHFSNEDRTVLGLLSSTCEFLQKTNELEEQWSEEQTTDAFIEGFPFFLFMNL